MIGVVHLNWHGVMVSVLFLSSFLVGNEAHIFVIVVAVEISCPVLIFLLVITAFTTGGRPG